MGDIFTHGLFSVNLLSVLVVIGCVVGASGDGSASNTFCRCGRKCCKNAVAFLC
ncbi:MAG: hypothetical protein ACLTMH_16615 [Faecalimonas umbilicata]|uniref:hypothetical protein n=1 Tax=Faecalimonas umbilicata TaxID=1912855 RepID=UPI0039948477